MGRREYKRGQMGHLFIKLGMNSTLKKKRQAKGLCVFLVPENRFNFSNLVLFQHSKFLGGIPWTGDKCPLFTLEVTDCFVT